jgi:hypothetical protein
MTAISRWLLLVWVSTAIAGGGCVRRVLMIRSEPDGALVTVDRTAVGHTPVAVPFTYYGTREIRLEKDGYEPVTSKQRILPPWYEFPPVSFVTQHFAGREIRDRREFDFRMTPKTITDESLLLERADQLRTDVARQTVVLPVAETAAPTTTR